ncbi:MAG: hypothetical protein ACRC62_24115 [Microcoleus sp.]
MIIGQGQTFDGKLKHIHVWCKFLTFNFSRFDPLPTTHYQAVKCQQLPVCCQPSIFWCVTTRWSVEIWNDRWRRTLQLSTVN